MLSFANGYVIVIQVLEINSRAIIFLIISVLYQEIISSNGLVQRIDMPFYMKSSVDYILSFLVVTFFTGWPDAKAQKTLQNVASAGVQFLSPDRISEYSATYERVLAEGSNPVFNVTGSFGGWSKEGGSGILMSFGMNFLSSKSSLHHFELGGNLMLPYNFEDDIWETCTLWQIGYRRDDLKSSPWGFRVGASSEMWRMNYQTQVYAYFGGYAALIRRF